MTMLARHDCTKADSALVYPAGGSNALAGVGRFSSLVTAVVILPVSCWVGKPSMTFRASGHTCVSDPPPHPMLEAVMDGMCVAGCLQPRHKAAHSFTPFVVHKTSASLSPRATASLL
jgi:hypothetical protein